MRPVPTSRGDKEMTDTIRVRFMEAEKGLTGWPPENLLHFRDWVNETIESIPEEFRDIAKIEFGSYVDCENAYTTLYVYGYRPETDEEKAHRAQREAEARTATERHERKLLGQLLHKYGKEGPSEKS